MNFYVIFTLLMGGVILFKLKDKRIGVFLLILFFVLSAFRGEGVGNDTDAYMDAHSIQYRGTVLADFANLEFDDIGSKVEILTNLINKIVYDSGMPPRWIIIFYSTIMMVFLLAALRRFNVNIAYALAFYVLLSFFFFSFNIARQFCSISIVLYAFSYLQEKTKKKYLFFWWIIVASLIHSFAIICIPIYFITKIPVFTQGWTLVAFLICIALASVKLDFINQLSLVLDAEHVSNYLEEYGGGEGLNTVGILVNWAYIFVLFYYYYRRSNYNYNNDRMINNLFLLSIVFHASLVNYSGVVGRIVYYISIIQIVYLAGFYSSIRYKLNKNDWIVFLGFFAYSIYRNAPFVKDVWLGHTDYYMGF